MPRKDPRITAYIAKAQPFARPILRHLRTVVHAACPRVQETIKWGMPHFDYQDAMLCMMASFKAHCTFGFWRGKELLGTASRNAEAMGDLGRITSLKDLPPTSELTALITRAMALTDAGGTRVPRVVTKRPPLRVPKDLREALDRDAKAKRTFDGFAPSHRREYVEWITEAKTAATRERRLATTLEWLAEGKSRNWKYART